MLGQRKAAARQIDQSIASLQQGEQRCHFAEVLRLRGWLYGLDGERENAERLLYRSLDLARAQGAKSWELRTAMTLAELLERDGEAEAALNIVRPVHAWFSEGFGSHDLQAAAGLIARLVGHPVPHALSPVTDVEMRSAS